MSTNTKLGKRKVVYDEGQGIRTIYGETEIIDDFIKIVTDSGELLINKKQVICIKVVSGRVR